jgi:hypothetical protein
MNCKTDIELPALIALLILTEEPHDMKPINDKLPPHLNDDLTLNDEPRETPLMTLIWHTDPATNIPAMDKADPSLAHALTLKELPS